MSELSFKLFENVIKICDLKKISVQDLSLQSGLSKNSIYQWKKSSPKFDNVYAVSRTLGMTVDEILHYDAEDYSYNQETKKLEKVYTVQQFLEMKVEEVLNYKKEREI